MGIWNNYSNRTPSGVAGGLYDLTAHTVDSFCMEAEDGEIKCGMGVVFGTNPGEQVALPSEASTLDKFAGVVMNGGTNEMDMDGNLITRGSSSQSVMQSGRVWVRLAADAEPTYGGQVHLVNSGTNAGCFDTTGGIAVNARFLTEVRNGIAAVELYNQLSVGGSNLPKEEEKTQ